MNVVTEPECANCGMIDVPLTRECCEGCICLRCKRTAIEAGRSMNEVGWCDDCEEDLHNRGPRRVPMNLVAVGEISTQEMRYTLRAMRIEVGRMDDHDVRVRYEKSFGRFVVRNPNHADPDR